MSIERTELGASFMNDVKPNVVKEKLKNKDVEWVVNDCGELGVKIKDQFFFLYKGESMGSGGQWRYVFKREFGETCYPWHATRNPKTQEYNIAPKASNYICHLGEPLTDWKDI